MERLFYKKGFDYLTTLRYRKKLMLVCMLSFFCIRGAFAIQMSGTYTIDAAGSATATNFKNFASAIAYLSGSGVRSDGGASNSAPFGLSGPVVFNVSAATYSGQVVLNGNIITGLSDVNTLTFMGSGITSTIVTASPTNQSAFIINKCNYVILRNMTISNLASAGSAVAIVGNNTTNKGTGCMVRGCKLTANANAYAFGVNITADSLGYLQSAVRADSITIDSNIITAYYGVSMFGASSYLYNRKIRLNTNTVTAFLTGIYANLINNGVEVMYNSVTSALFQTTASGNMIYLRSCINTNGPDQHKIIGNKINSAGTGINIELFSVAANPDYPTIIYNNMIFGRSIGILINSSISNHFQVYHNSVNINNPTSPDFSAATGISYSNSSNGTLKCRNNIFAVTNAGLNLYAVAAGFNGVSTNTDSFDIDNNIYYNASVNKLVARNSVFYSDSVNNNYRATNAGGDSSYNLLPAFVSATDLHLEDGYCGVKGINLGGSFTSDLDGNLRPALPEIGCVEYAKFSLNLKVNPLGAQAPLQRGTQDLEVKVVNMGTLAVSSFTAAYRVDGLAPVTQAWSGLLNPCDTATVLFTGMQQLTIDSSSNNLKVYTYDPNGTADQYAKNDTVATYTQMQGVYTIGTAPSNYTTFDAAIADMYQRGLGGPVLFKVKSGTYPAISITGQKIKGMGPTARVTFEGTTGTVISSANDPVIGLISCQDITLRNLTVNGTASATSGIYIYGSPNVGRQMEGQACMVKNCLITMVAGGTGTGIRASIPNATNGFLPDSIEIDSNTITGGNAGIRLEGNNLITANRDFKVRWNTIQNVATYGVYSAGNGNGMDIMYNTFLKGPNNISNTLAPGNGPAAISLNTYLNGPDTLRIIGNRIESRMNYGISFFECYSPTIPVIIANNSIVNATHTGIYITCLYLPYFLKYELYHNSVRMDTAATYGLFMTNTYSGANIKANNNIFAVTALSGTTYPVYCAISPGGPNVLDHNLYYNASGPALLFRGKTYTAANIKTALGGGDSSLTEDPAWIAGNDLHLRNGCTLRGTNMTGYIPLDIENRPRANPPSLGAYEFTPGTNDISVQALVNPTSPSLGGTQDVKVRVVNNGSNTVTSFKVSYQQNGNAPVTKTWTGAMSPCDTVTVIFSGADQITISPVNTLKIYTQEPNGLADLNKLNDTINTKFGIVMSGIYTIGGTTPDYTTFNQAVADLYLRGVNGPVTFHVRAGTYNEQVEIGPNITGLNAANRITFKSQDANQDSVKIAFKAAFQNNFVFRLNNVSYITLKDLTFQPIDSTFARSLELAGLSSYNIIEGCKFIGHYLKAAGVYSGANIYANLFEGGKNIIRNNTMLAGQYGIYLVGFSRATPSDSNIFERNTIQNSDQFDYSFTYASNLKIRDNTSTKTNPSTSAHQGIYVGSCDSALVITGNKVSTTTGGSGINMNGSTASLAQPAIIANNILTISGGTIAMQGIGVSSCSNLKIYHNSVNYGTTVTNTYASYLIQNTATDVYNNIFANYGGGGASFLYGPINMDHNLLYTTGANLILTSGMTPTNYPTLAAWRKASGNNLNSVSYRPAFTSATNLAPNPADSAVWAINGRGTQLDSTLAGKDFNGVIRPASLSRGVPDLGAYEVIPATAPPAAIVTGSIAADSTQYFVFASDTVASIKWGSNAPFPSTISMRQYSGEKPPAIGAEPNYMYFYTDVTVPAGTYNSYDLNVYYKNAWLGTISAKDQLRLINKPAGSPWNTSFPLGYGSPADTIRNMMPATFVSSFGYFTGADLTSPLPVNLMSFTASLVKDDVSLAWSTASEINNMGFVIERSPDGKKFEKIGFEKGAGNSNGMQYYRYTDANIVFPPTGTVYYRLRQRDHDGKESISAIVSVTKGQKTAPALNVFPNPFSETLAMEVTSPVQSFVVLTITDITGREMLRGSKQVSAGSNLIQLNEMGSFEPGVYFLLLNTDGKIETIKVIKK